MVRLRVIPVLLLRGEGLYKTTAFAKPRYVGDPINVVRIFNEKEVDEIVILDIEASKQRRPPRFDLVEQIVSEAFMPVCYGGGVRTVEDARTLLKLGVEKISVNTAALESPSLVRELSQRFGAQCVVASVDVKRSRLRGYETWSHSGAKVRQRDPVRWARELVSEGAGEILLTSVDRDGTLRGYDRELLRRFDGAVNVPIIACGGAADVDDMVAATQACRLSGVGVGARFVYYGPHRAVLITYLSPEEMERLQRAYREGR